MCLHAVINRTLYFSLKKLCQSPCHFSVVDPVRYSSYDANLLIFNFSNRLPTSLIFLFLPSDLVECWQWHESERERENAPDTFLFTFQPVQPSIWLDPRRWPLRIPIVRLVSPLPSSESLPPPFSLIFVIHLSKSLYLPVFPASLHSPFTLSMHFPPPPIHKSRLSQREREQTHRLIHIVREYPLSRSTSTVCLIHLIHLPVPSQPLITAKKAFC